MSVAINLVNQYQRPAVSTMIHQIEIHHRHDNDAGHHHQQQQQQVFSFTSFCQLCNSTQQCHHQHEEYQSGESSEQSQYQLRTAVISNIRLENQDGHNINDRQFSNHNDNIDSHQNIHVSFSGLGNKLNSNDYNNNDSYQQQRDFESSEPDHYDDQRSHFGPHIGYDDLNQQHQAQVQNYGLSDHNDDQQIAPSQSLLTVEGCEVEHQSTFATKASSIGLIKLLNSQTPEGGSSIISYNSTGTATISDEQSSESSCVSLNDICYSDLYNFDQIEGSDIPDSTTADSQRNGHFSLQTALDVHESHSRHSDNNHKRGRPKRKSPRTKNKTNGKLWEFIRDLLLNDKTNPSHIKWERLEEGVFKFVQSDKVAKMWGERKQNPKMTYEKLSRAMRYYYKSKVLLPVFGKRLVYKFGPNATGWRPNV